MIRAATQDPADFLERALESFETALRSGMKLQEDSAQRYIDVLRNVDSPVNWKDGVPTQLSKAIAATQENIAQSIHVMSENAQRIVQSIYAINENTEKTIGLMEKALRLQCSNSEVGEEDGYFWTYSLNAMRANAEIVQQANARVVETWANLANDVMQRIENMQAQVRRATENGKTP